MQHSAFTCKRNAFYYLKSVCIYMQKLFKIIPSKPQSDTTKIINIFLKSVNSVDNFY